MKLNERSSRITKGDKRAPNRAMLRAVGFNDADFNKPIVGIASSWSDITPCNAHIDKLAVEGKKGVEVAGGKAPSRQEAWDTAKARSTAAGNVKDAMWGVYHHFKKHHGMLNW